MHRRRNVTQDIWRAVVVAGAMLGTASCSGSQKPAGAAEATPVAPESASAAGEGAPQPEPVTGEADQAVEMKRAPVEVADAGLPDAAPPDAAPPDAAPPPPKPKRPRGQGGKPSGRGFIIA